jgi:hypothetical protein
MDTIGVMTLRSNGLPAIQLGPTLVPVPGSYSTGAAWRPIMAALGKALPVRDGEPARIWRNGRTPDHAGGSIAHEAEAVEAVIRKTGAPVWAFLWRPRIARRRFAPTRAANKPRDC